MTNRTLYIRNNKGGNNAIIIDMDDTIDTIAMRFTGYTDRYDHINFILDLDDAVSFKSVQYLIKVLRMILEYNNATLDITLRCDKLLREYDVYGDIKKLM